MNKALTTKVGQAISTMRDLWTRLRPFRSFVAFSTGKDSLAMAAMLYEAVYPERPPCLYAHHDMEFPSNLDYLAELRPHGFKTEVVRPFLSYFDLTDRGIGFITLHDAWCVPMLVGTGLLDWLRQSGARSPRSGVMFRGMSGSEYSRKYHRPLELYERLDLPTVNPLLGFTRDEILLVIKDRYGLPLNPIYQHMNRTYCICCYTADQRRQQHSAERFPEVCRRYYAHIEGLLFDSGLVEQSGSLEQHKTREEKLIRQGFAHWRRTKAQSVVGAVRRRLRNGALSYSIRDLKWVDTKHLRPVEGRWTQSGSEIRFWGLSQKTTDTLIKRMINCLDCGFCAVECFPCRQFDRATKQLRIEGCVQCGKCLRLTFCMGWRHRFWRRIIVDAK